MAPPGLEALLVGFKSAVDTGPDPQVQLLRRRQDCNLFSIARSAFHDRGGRPGARYGSVSRCSAFKHCRLVVSAPLMAASNGCAFERSPGLRSPSLAIVSRIR